MNRDKSQRHPQKMQTLEQITRWVFERIGRTEPKRPKGEWEAMKATVERARQ
jgi:hypothetical protein